LHDPRLAAIPDVHGHAKGEHKKYAEERPIPYTARMLFLWFYHACRRGAPRFMMVSDHINYLTFEDPAAVNLVRRALKLAHAGDLYGASETAGVEPAHAAVVSEGLRRGMRYSIGAEVDNDPRCRPDAQNIVEAMRPDGMIRSVHFLAITHPQHGDGWLWPFDNPEFADLFDVIGVERTWELYMATLIEAIETLPGQIVAHFYVPAKFGHWPDDATLEGYEDRLVNACEARGMAIEINTRALYRGDEAQREKYRAANVRLMRKAQARGVGIATSADAHSPRDQGAAYGELLDMLDDAGVNELAFPVDGRLLRVALRVKQEPKLIEAPVPKTRKSRAAATPTPTAAEATPAQRISSAASPSDATAETAAADAASARTAKPKRTKKPAPAVASAEPPAVVETAADAPVPVPLPSASPAKAAVSRRVAAVEAVAGPAEPAPVTASAADGNGPMPAATPRKPAAKASGRTATPAKAAAPAAAAPAVKPARKAAAAPKAATTPKRGAAKATVKPTARPAAAAKPPASKAAAKPTVATRAKTVAPAKPAKSAPRTTVAKPTEKAAAASKTAAGARAKTAAPKKATTAAKPAAKKAAPKNRR